MPRASKRKEQSSASEDEPWELRRLNEARDQAALIVEKLLKEKHISLQAVVDKTHEEFDKLEEQVRKHCEAEQEKRVRARLAQVQAIIECVEKRKAIETEMHKIVLDMHKMIQETERGTIDQHQARLETVRSVISESSKL